MKSTEVSKITFCVTFLLSALCSADSKRMTFMSTFKKPAPWNTSNESIKTGSYIHLSLIQGEGTFLLMYEDLQVCFWVSKAF